jgi:proline iminopeptidase
MARLAPTLVRSTSDLSWVRSLVADRRLATVAAVATSLFAGLLTSFFAPHGPTTAANALAVMALALLVGIVGGCLARSRWILVPLAGAYIVGAELGRLGVVGPTLDIRFDNAYGIIALVITRGAHGLLAFLPMALGVPMGTALARRIGWSPPRARRQPPVGSGLLGLGVAALAILVAWPAATPPVLGADGRPIPGSIAELATVHLGGTDQAVMIRAASPDKPVLLYLSGGPGQSDLALARVLSAPWTNDFVFVDWDQRGNGKSYAAFEPSSAMTLARAVSDTIELTDYLRTRFGEQKIYLMGESWGTILGVLAVQQRPDLYYAWIGSGQMVDVVETDRRIYSDLTAYAARTGDAALAAKLREIGQPPYRDIPWANSNLLAWYEYLYPSYTPSAGYQARGAASGLDPFGVLGSEYSLIEKANVLRGLIDTFAVLYPQLYGIDFRRDVPRLEVPVYILDGAAELKGRRDLAIAWFDALQAPTKSRVTFTGAAHSVAFEQADEVLRLLNETIVPATYGK